MIYLVFNEGYTATSGDLLVREDLCAEAIRLGRTLAELMPDEPEVVGLLALMLLDRRPSTGPHGRRWRPRPAARAGPHALGPGLIGEGQELVRCCLRRNIPGPYQIQAAINAVHSDAPVAAETDWRQILALYDQLLVFEASPVVALNRAVALAEVEGPGGGVDRSRRPAARVATTSSTRCGPTCCDVWAVRPKRPCLRVALARTDNEAERAFLERARRP